jgi:C4-dicarboxylate transporter DctM subunit
MEAKQSGVVRAMRALDEAVHAAERWMIAVALIAATVTVAIDFGYQQIVRPRGPEAPFVAIGIAFLVLLAACLSAESKAGKPFFGKPKVGAAIVAAIGTLVVSATTFAIVRVPSSQFYLAAYVASVTAYLAWTAKTRGLEAGDLLGVALVSPPIVYFSLVHIPLEYSWSKEVAMLLILWIGFFGASVCAKAGAHLRFEALEKTAPPALAKSMRALGHLASATFCGFMAFLGYAYVFDPEVGLYVQGALLEQTQIPDWVQTVAVPIAFALAAARFIAAAISSILGGSYGAPTNLEAGAMAEGAETAKAAPKKQTVRRVIFFALVVLTLVLPFVGKTGILLAVILGLSLVGAPIFVLMGAVVVACFMLWGGVTQIQELTLVERIRSLADNQSLLTIPFFVMSGAIMSRGAISRRLMDFSTAFVGWLPGGLGIAAVLACVIFAAISGSSPATVVAIGGMMGPALIAQGYKGPFAHGIVTSAGSLGILIPPSIPMVIYAIVNTTATIDVQRLFAAGYGPGIVIALVLSILAVVHGVRHKLPRQPFSVGRLWTSTREGAWALAFPILMALGVRYLTAVELSCFSVVYAVFVEIVPHRALKLEDVPKVLAETSVLLGAFLVILVVAMALGEFIETQGIAESATEWVASLDLEPWQFLVAVNLLLLVIGCLLDIMSAIFIFVPLLAPMALVAGVDPIHFGIIFIVNLEIGYLTPPVGLNLFVASTLFEKPVEYMIKATLPFVAVMLIGLTIITFDGGATSVGFADWILGNEETAVPTPTPSGPIVPDAPDPAGPGDGTPRIPTLEEMMREAEGGGAAPTTPQDGQRIQTLEEMMRQVEAEDGDDAP